MRLFQELNSHGEFLFARRWSVITQAGSYVKADILRAYALFTNLLDKFLDRFVHPDVRLAIASQGIKREMADEARTYLAGFICKWRNLVRVLSIRIVSLLGNVRLLF
jgi:hypothetical protein